MRLANIAAPVHGCLRLLFLWLGIALLSFLPAAAQRYQVRTYDQTEGLLNARVQDIAQDSSGRLWFATQQGLTTYDGFEWVHHDPTGGLKHVDLRFVLVDDQDRVFALSHRWGRGIYLYSGDEWQKLPTMPGLEGPGLNVLAATTVTVGGEPVLVAAFEGEGVLLWSGTAWRRSGWRSAIGDARVNAFENSDGRLYVGTTSGLFAGDPGRLDSGIAAVEGVPAESIMSLSHDPAGLGLWIVGRDWIGLLAGDRFELLGKDLPLLHALTFPDMISQADGLGAIFVGNDAGLFRFDERDGLREQRRESGCLEDGAVSLLLDREGNVWTAGSRGVSKIVSLRFANYDSEHGLFSSEVTAVLQRRSGEVVLGHRFGLTFMGEPRRHVDFGTRDHEVRVLDLAEDDDGNIWIAGQARGLGRLDRNGSLSWFGPGIGLMGDVNSVLVDREGMLWIASSLALITWKDDRIAEITLPQAVDGRRYFRKLSEGPDGTIYLSTGSEGVYVIRGRKSERWHVDSPPIADSVYAVHIDREGRTWIGTADGLYRRAGGRTLRSTLPGPEVRRPVFLIQTDAEGRLWCGTNDGVYRWDGARTEHFTVEDGLIGRETNRGGGLVDSAGEVWIGTEQGLSVYRSHLDRGSRAAPTVRLLELDAGGHTYDLDDRVRLSGNQGAALFRFRATALTDEDSILFRSMLEGFDEEWLGPRSSPAQEIRYTNLPPGKYRFLLQATARGQPWSDVVSSGAIIIRAPFWRRPWFVALGVALAGLALFGALRIDAQRRYARRLEEELRLRLEETQRLQEDIARAQRLEALGVLAGGIAHDFNNLLAVIVGSVSLLLEEGELGERAGEVIRETLAAADRAKALTMQMLTFAQGGAPVLKAGSITEVVRESASFVVRGSSVRCDFELPDDLWMVEMDFDQISQVVSNLLLNAKQATGEGGKIFVRGRNLEIGPVNLPLGRYVEIEIEDHGCGIPEENLEKIFDPYFSTKEKGTGLGLATAYSIVHRHGGRLTVESTAGVGSTFRIYLRATERVTEAVEAPPPVSAPPAGGRILVMDDDEAVRSIIRAMLQRIGYSVECAEDGESALHVYRNAMSAGESFDVVLMDLTIPGGMGGKQAVKKLLEMDPEAKAVVLSGYSNDPVLADPVSYGFRAGMSKPASMEELRETLHRVLQ